MAKLKLNGEDGKKGSKKPVDFGEVEIQAFEELKQVLAQNLGLYQPRLDQPFFVRTDASDFAVGAQLCQNLDGQLRTVALFSRKLNPSQLNWAVKEKEMYAVVAALHKWAGIINFQPVTVQTDHRALEHWVTENVDTPSGPRGRRGRWHEILSTFDIEIEYLPGKENVVADAMSRWAYPATSARQDVSWHGSEEAKREAERQISQEFWEGRKLMVVRTSPTQFPFDVKIVEAESPTYIRPLKKFQFWKDLTPDQRARLEEERAGDPRSRLPSAIEPGPSLETPAHPPGVEIATAPPPGFRFATRRPEVGSGTSVYILGEKWTDIYVRSNAFQQIWNDCTAVGTLRLW